ncbi:putative MFS metabolite transporter [hydrothermal vent metagenome]|uniref:Putative MFS metabolite transporter n=1 Tax=hydrothermal vent metagenome TaxID=652676 RepID=A0A1W1CAC1_9ZZZZ
MNILLSSFYFFYFSVVGVYIIFIPKVLTTFGYSAEQIGIIFAAGPLVRFILPMLFIRGLKLERKAFNISLLIMLVSVLSFYTFVESFYELLLSNIFLGVGLGVTLPYIEVIALEKLGRENYGKIRLFGSLGFVLVALVLVNVLSSPMIALEFLLCLTFATAIFAFFIVHELYKTNKQKKELQNDINLFKDWKLWLGLTLMQLSFGAFYNFFTIYATDNGISLETTIYLWSFGVGAEIIMFRYQARFLSSKLLLVLQITTLLTAFRWSLVFAYPQNILILYFSQSLHAFSFALFHSAAIAYLHQLYKHKALAQQFFAGITYGLGGFIGALLSGMIYEHYPEYLFLSSSLIAFMSFIFIVLWKKKVIKQLG